MLIALKLYFLRRNTMARLYCAKRLDGVIEIA